MAIEIERLIATLEANFNTYDRALKKLLGSTDGTFARIERRGKEMESRLAALGGNVGRGLLGFLAGGVSLRGAQQLVDAATRIENALKVAGLSGDELTRVYDRLFASAQRNAAPLESLVTLYGRAAIVQRELGVSTEELLGFTDNVALALRVAGTDAQSASGALLQLSQALGAGTVRAEEFNSILEGALPIAQAAAAGLKEAGGSVAKLRQLVVDGKVSSEAFFRAFEAGSAMLEEKVAGATLTTQQAFQQLENALVDAAGRIDEATGASEGAIDALGRLAGVVTGLSSVFAAAANGPIGSFIGQLNTLNGLIMQIMPGISILGLLNEDSLNGIAGGISRLGAAVAPNSRAELEALYSDLANAGGSAAAPAIRERIAQIERDLYGSGPSTRGRSRPATDIGTITVKQPVSLSDYAAPKASGGSRGGGSSRENAFEREVEQIKKRTDAILGETMAMQRLNPLVEDYGFEVEHAAAVHELLTAAQDAGLKVTPELRAQIEQLASGYATASAEADKLAEEQKAVRDAAEDLRNLGKDAMKGFISDLIEGKSASEALANALGKIGDKLLDMALDNLFSGGLGLGKGGLLGGILIPGILHGGGVAGRDGYGHGRAVAPSVFAGARRYHGGGVAGLRPDEVPAILQRGEVVLPKRATSLGRGGGNVVHLTQHYNLAGAISPRDVRAMAESGAAQAVDMVRRSLNDWQVQIARDGALS